MKFLRAEYEIKTPIIHNSRFISGHYFRRFFSFPTRCLGVIVAADKWQKANQSDFFTPYYLPARSTQEYFNSLASVGKKRAHSYKSRKIYTINNFLIMDILDPDLMKVNEFINTLQEKQGFQFGAMESRGNGICHYISSKMYDLPNKPINSADFLIEFISDFIPKKYFTPDYLTAAIKNQLKFAVPDDFKISFKSLPDITRRRYYIKDDLEFNVIPQF
ncbi:MAG: hypothetical protein EU551_04110, partial [Promethearchaeota archaeon]